MFPPEMQVLMADSSLRRIDGIKAGDWVISHTGWPRAVLANRVADWTGKLLKFRPGKQNWIVSSSDTRWIFSGNRGVFSAPVQDTGNSDCLVGIPVVSKGEEECEIIYSRLLDCSFAKAKQRKLFSLDVEEEHSFAVVPDGSKIAIFVRS